MPQYFTVEDANALLPRLIPIVQELKELKRQQGAARSELEAAMPPAPSNGHARDPRAIRQGGRAVARIEQRVERLIRSVHAFGCRITDQERGLVDFPAMKDEREIWLCWRPEEPSVAWWHELEAGFAGRTPL
ncbi:MAG: DUF2203 domain-containing protein [Chloroflexi bacterium]|nr:DUF2203 domain-containing protein [Chloroflexota bacterium]